MAIASLGESAI
ncbi:hypothetical protein ACHAW6_015063 [Cyclotella cf. meneghiniana]